MKLRIVSALAVITLILSWLLTGCTDVPTNPDEQQNMADSLGYAFYIKQSDVYIADINSGKCERLTNGQDGENSQLRLSKDKKRVFFMDKNENGATALFTAQTADVAQTRQELAQDVQLFDIDSTGSRVLYALKNEATQKADLYLHDLKESAKVAESVMRFGFTDVQELVFYAPLSEEDAYVVPDDNASGLSDDQLIEDYGGLHNFNYMFNGAYSLDSHSLYVDDTLVDDDDVDSSGIFHDDVRFDRILYYAGTTDDTDDRPLRIKLFVEGQEPITVDDTLTTCRAAFAGDEAVVYVDDFDKQTNMGDLVLYHNGQYKTLDSGVQTVLNLSYIERASRSVMYHSTLFSVYN